MFGEQTNSSVGTALVSAAVYRRAAACDDVWRTSRQLRAGQLVSICDDERIVTRTTRWYTQGEVASQSLWSRYDRHFVGITRHNALS